LKAETDTFQYLSVTEHFDTKEISDETGQSDEFVAAESKQKDVEDSDTIFSEDLHETGFQIDPQAISAEMIEAAVESVIKKMFSEKIESMLVNVIERKITGEVDRLKRILLRDASNDE